MTSNDYSDLFAPIHIGQVKIENRIAMAPMGIKGLTDQNGNLTQRAIDYYLERARGEVGLIITSVFKVENDIDGLVAGMPMVTSALIGPLGELSEAIHSLGGKIFVQLTAGWGRVAMPGVRLQHVPVSASAVPNYWDPSIICRALETAEVETLVNKFGDAAEILAKAGVDGVELHGHEGYLFDQFTTSIWNMRKDKYGGDLKARLRFPIEVLDEIKARVGNGFPVQYRFGLKHYIKGLNKGALPSEDYVEAGRDVAEGIEMAKLLEKAGFDALHVDAGCYDSWYWAHPPTYQKHGCMVDMAAKVKEFSKVPIITAGRLEIPELAESIIKEGKADIIALGRGLLADPYWPIKVKEKRYADILPCIGCHKGCLGRMVPQRKPLSCAVNPACGREEIYRLRPSKTKKTVIIAGGGLAGMEAARVASLRGHEVVLYEKKPTLGGHLIEASVPDFKKDLERLKDWYTNQLDKMKIELHLETELTVEMIHGRKPDMVLIATGSKYFRPTISGIDKANVITCTEALLNPSKIGNSVVIIGAGLIGCETALWLAKEGKKVRVIEKAPEPLAAGYAPPHANRVMLLDLLAFYNVSLMCDAEVVRFNNSEITVNSKIGGTTQLSTDTVLLAIGLQPEDGLYDFLKGSIARIYKVGDCREVGDIMRAIWDAYEVGRKI